jgi:hypothetical protein
MLRWRKGHLSHFERAPCILHLAGRPPHAQKSLAERRLRVALTIMRVGRALSGNLTLNADRHQIELRRQDGPARDGGGNPMR